MKKILLPALLALTLALGAASPALAAEHREMRKHGEMRGGPGMERLFHNLDLQPEQRDQLKTIRTRHRQAAESLRAELRKKREELFALMKAPAATREQGLAKQREVQNLEGRLGEIRLNSWFEARKVLSPEQLKKLGAPHPYKNNNIKDNIKNKDNKDN